MPLDQIMAARMTDLRQHRAMSRKFQFRDSSTYVEYKDGTPCVGILQASSENQMSTDIKNWHSPLAGWRRAFESEADHGFRHLVHIQRVTARKHDISSALEAFRRRRDVTFACGHALNVENETLAGQVELGSQRDGHRGRASTGLTPTPDA